MLYVETQLHFYSEFPRANKDFMKPIDCKSAKNSDCVE